MTGQSLLQRNERWVLARPDGRRLGHKSALKAFRDAQEAAGVGPYRFHDLRRAVARRLEQARVPRSNDNHLSPLPAVSLCGRSRCEANESETDYPYL